jgi:NAD(P)-dependent dehydrogenase (short-subunit alcohol dehydrogenase family)
LPTILITGTGRGLGLELARQYAQDGWRVIGTVRSPAPQLRETVTLDCNAGISGKRGMALGSFDYDEWEKVLRVNLLGAAAVIEALIQNVAASERKTVATLPYSTSKAALNLLAKGLAANLAPRGIIVVALSPGWVKTDMGGESAPLTPQASVRGLRNVISRLRREDSGKFFSYEGVIIPW